MGDNGDGAKAQDLSIRSARCCASTRTAASPRTIPTSAPKSGLARAIWASGLRNPFTFAMQPGTGRIHINDVGLDTWEEINVGSAGANYGWPQSEGPDNLTPLITAPLFAYSQAAASPAGSAPGGFFTGVAIAGGAFYPAGGSFPAAYHGNYFFADFGNRYVARLDAANGDAAYAFAQMATSPVDMLVATDGALLVLTRSAVVRIAAQ